MLANIPMKKVGVLGGMGPEATILLQRRLINVVDANDDVDHLPLLIDMNPQVPSRLKWIIENQGEDPGPVLAEMAFSLQSVGAEALVMPCNTAHHFVPDIKQRISVSFLNMPELAALKVKDVVGDGCRVGVLASPATKITGLFEKIFEENACEVIFPEKQTAILDAIKSIKANGPDAATIRTLQCEADKLMMRGVKCIIIGCSEFSLLSDSIRTKVPLIDTLDVLVDHIVAFSGAKRKRGS